VTQETKNLPIIQIDLENQDASRFDQTVIEAVDLSFSKLGVRVKDAFYSSLSAEYKLSKENIPLMIEEFVEALENIFGTSSLLLEIDVMKNLRKKVPEFKFEAENSNLSFISYIKSLRNFMEYS
jgi:hypothetical protein